MSAANPEHLIFISGASSGIGLAMLETLPYADARVLNLSRRPAPGSEHVALDLSDPAAWPAAEARFHEALATFTGGQVTFVHSAGVLSPIRFAGEGDPEAEIRNVLLNSAAPQALGHAFLRALSRRDPEPRSTLLFIGSGASSAAYMGWSGYCAGKAATDHWTRTVGAELDRRGRPCRVLCIAPGIVQTAMQAEIRDTPARDFPEVARFIELHEGGALRTPKDVAGELWALLERDHPNGAVLDLRDA